jgi:uncharacterized SAM-binding protein YcdF (DUF218 family)
VLLWLRPEVQEVPRALTPSARLRDLLLLLIAALLGVGALASYATFRIWQQGGRDEQRPVGAIVVMGAAQFNGTPSAVYAARLDHAVSLYLHGIARYLVVTGGKAEGDRSTEARAGRDFAIARGVPAGAILEEDKGRTTLESLEGVAALLRTHRIADAVFVSDPTHMLRVLRIAGDLGISALGSPTPTSRIEADGGRKLEATFHELGALVLYFFARQAPQGELTGEPSDGAR